MKNSLLIAGMAVLALVCGVLFGRLGAISERLEALERRGLGQRTASTSTPPSVVPEAPSVEAALRSETARPMVVAPPIGAAAPSPAVPPAPTALQDAVAKEVERQLQARGPSIAFSGPQDPLTVLEKELGLSPAQKIRIGELFQQRDEEQRKLFEKGGPPQHLKALPELEARYEAEILRELDYAQQQKYEQLKKDGKLQQGVVFRVQISGDAR